jgi:DDE superfamily endonuclease
VAAGEGLDHEPGATVAAKKKPLARIKRLVSAHATWVLGDADAGWWSRFEQPRLHAWTENAPLRLQAGEQRKADKAPQAICCYGGLRRDTGRVLVRVLDGRPVSQVTPDFLRWVCEPLAAAGKRVLALVWDNASWHKSQQVRRWIKAPNRAVKRAGGVRMLAVRLPIKSPWVHPIAPHWGQAKRAGVEAERTLTPPALITRGCEYFRCDHYEHLKQHVS